MLRSNLRSIMGVKRRSFLGATALTVGFAGCLGGSNGSDSGAATTTESSGSTEPAAGTDVATASPASEAPGTTADIGTSETTGTATAGTTVQVLAHPDLGNILVGPNRMTLYMFDQDTNGESASTCYDSCVESWPPLTATGDPSAGTGVTAQLATFERETGETQVMAGGWPLYYFAPDEQSGDATGQGVNDVWWVLSPDGTPIKQPTTTTVEETSTGGGEGVSY